MTVNNHQFSTPIRFAISLVFILGLCTCTEKGISFKKEKYERITGIKFPRKYKVIEAYEYQDIFSVTVFRVDHSSLEKFVADYQLDPLKKMEESLFYGNRFLEQYKADFKTTDNVYFIGYTRGNYNWTYIADLDSNMLWAEVFYPPGDSGK